MNNIPIFLASDNNYAPFVSTTIASIVENTKSFINFYILDSGISEENKAKIARIEGEFSNFSVEYIKIDIQKLFGDFPLHVKEHTLNVFSRYLIPQLRPDLKKVIYLDVDIIVKGDIADLFNISLGGNHLGAIPEYTDVLENHIKELAISNTHKYFNAGILVIDCDYFRKNNLTDLLIKKTMEIKPKYQDQDILNIVFQDNYKILNYKFNVSSYMNEFNNKKMDPEVQEALKKPFIIHYSTFKPWNDRSVIFADDFWYYARKTSFYEILLENIINLGNKTKQESIRKLRLFNLITIFTIENRINYAKIKLLNVVPFIKIRKDENNIDVCLFSWKLLIFSIKNRNL